ncbi:MAG TPA: hypothetical protein VLY83_03695 [Methanoregula sp.]|nr:hypothetical protein [Methanoregula sp.]
MRALPVCAVLMITAVAGVCILPAAAEIPPGGTGWIAFQTNLDGASVFINSVLKGTTDTGGEFDIPYESSFTSYSVTKSHYISMNGTIGAPQPGGNTEIPLLMMPVPLGSGIGYFMVRSNVDGATVSFNGQVMGLTTNRSFTLPVATTDDLYTSFAVTRAGYRVYTAPLSKNPANGEVVELDAPLDPLPAQTLIGGSTGVFVIHCNVDGASVAFDNQSQGLISGGILNVTVYTTGTPFRTFSVSAAGYGTVTGPLPPAPGPGQPRDIYVTLTPLPAMTRAAPLPEAMAFGAVVGAGAVTLGAKRRNHR